MKQKNTPSIQTWQELMTHFIPDNVVKQDDEENSGNFVNSAQIFTTKFCVHNISKMHTSINFNTF